MATGAATAISVVAREDGNAFNLRATPEPGTVEVADAPKRTVTPGPLGKSRISKCAKGAQGGTTRRQNCTSIMLSLAPSCTNAFFTAFTKPSGPQV